MHIDSTSVLMVILAIFFQLVKAAENEDVCRIPADPDILGLGVRLGLYFQLCSNFFLELVRVGEARDSMMPTLFFFTSFFVAFVYSVIHDDLPPGAAIASTWFPILIYAGLFSFDLRGFNPTQKLVRVLINFALLISSSCLNIWFWFKGLDVQHPDQCMEPRCFFFANLGTTGGIRIVFRILAFLPLIFVLSMLIITYIIVSRKGNVGDNELGTSTISTQQVFDKKVKRSTVLVQSSSMGNTTSISEFDQFEETVAISSIAGILSEGDDLSIPKQPTPTKSNSMPAPTHNLSTSLPPEPGKDEESGDKINW